MELSDCLKELRREYTNRYWVCPTLVTQGKMTRQESDDLIAAWQNVLSCIEDGHGDKEAAIAEINKEIASRTRVYAKLIQSGELSHHVADRQMKRLRYALDYLKDKTKPNQQSLF